jgi:hypothetical protein
MRINTTRILFAFAVGLGISIVFSFPAGSSGAVRLDGGPSRSSSDVGRIHQPDLDTSTRLIIDTSKHSLTIHRQGELPLVLKAQGAYAMKHGNFSVTRKETNPLWQAPPTYFLRRGLSVPVEGSPERSMRGALGARALFLDQGRVIHSGPVWNDDVGGIKLSSQDMAMLFEVVAVGATVEVR